MAQNEYQRGYGKGYNTAERAALGRIENMSSLIAELRERAERAEAGLGFGNCVDCLHWQRERDCKWGWCLLTENIVTLDWPWRGEPDQKIVTQQNFGCIRYSEQS